MNAGDIFEFLGYKNIRCKPSEDFYDRELKRYVKIGNNVFVAIAFYKQEELIHDSLYFTDGVYLFHMLVNSENVREGLCLSGNVFNVRSI